MILDAGGGILRPLSESCKSGLLEIVTLET